MSESQSAESGPNDVPPSRRLLGHEIKQPITGIPAFLHRHLDSAIASTLDEYPLFLDAMALRLGLDWSTNGVYHHTTAGESLVGLAGQTSDGVYLDLVQLTLRVATSNDPPDRKLGPLVDRILAIAGSAYAVSPDGRSIVNRNDATAEDAARAVVADGGEPAEHIAAAWNAAFGREPNAQAAWAAAIRAVEASLIPILWPDPTRRGKQTLTAARNRLRDELTMWRIAHPTITLETVVGMLSSLAYEPRRHGADNRQAATLDDAAAAVHLAVTLVGWLRSGLLVAK